MKRSVTGILFITFFFSGAIFAQTGESWKASEQTVEKLSLERHDIIYREEKVPAFSLPDPLRDSKGQQVKDADGWMNGRRDEILELFRKNVYGRVPATKYTQTYRTMAEDRNAIGGKATMKQVDINIESGGKSLVIHLLLFVPNLSKPAPAFLLIDNRGPANTDPERKVKNDFWPVEEAIARGYAMAVYHNSDVDPDNFDDFKNGIHGILDVNPRPDDAWATLAAWAWGASRCLDYLQTDKLIAGNKVAVIGHSRGGKTALWAGAEDKRFALVISNESGCGGAALARRKFGETVAKINQAFPHWFCMNYRKYNGNEDAMPVDMHMLLALIAPRPLYIGCASDDLWGDPKGSYLSMYYAAPVYALFDKNTKVPETMPAVDTPVMFGKMAYHVRSGSHDLTLKDWNWYMDFADKVMK